MTELSLDALSVVFQHIDPLETPVDLVCKKWNKASKRPEVQQAWAKIDQLEKIAQEWNKRLSEKRGTKISVQLDQIKPTHTKTQERNVFRVWLHPKPRLVVRMGNHTKYRNYHARYRQLAIAARALFFLNFVGYFVITKRYISERISGRVFLLSFAVCTTIMIGSMTLTLDTVNALGANVGEIPVLRFRHTRAETIKNRAYIGHFRNVEDLKVAYMLGNLYDVDRQLASTMVAEYNAKIRRRYPLPR